MKLSTYHKRLGDNVVFFKGDCKELLYERITDKCVSKLHQIEPTVEWNAKRRAIYDFIKTRKQLHLESIGLEKYNTEMLLTNWVIYYKDYYWKKWYLREPEWDRIYVTTLFTFYFDITVKTINDLKPLLKQNGMFMVGGVLATLQPKEIEEATGIKPHIGLLNKPGELDGGTNNMIVDTLPLDYTILEEIEYKYEMSNAYFAYMTRGCIRHCKFCAVKTLEPVFEDYIPLKERIEQVRNVCGEQRDLLLMDNNVIASNKFDDIIQEIVDCGFYRGATYIEPDFLAIAVENLKRGINPRGYIRKAQSLLYNFYLSIKDKDVSYDVYSILDDYHLLKLENATKENIIKSYDKIYPYYQKTLQFKRPRKRKVDFNQGLDGRLFNDHIAYQFSRIAISPLRIAFDDISYEKIYTNAIRMCAKYEMKDFANYILYNFNDKPIDLYKRLKINVELCEELGVSINSFPMKYHPLYGGHSHDRNYIGKHWNMKYIRSVQAILNATKGSIGRGKTFFYKAFGNDETEFNELLNLPDVMIVYRFFFEWLDTKEHPYSRKMWRQHLEALNDSERKLFESIIYDDTFTTASSNMDYGEKINQLLKFYVPLRDQIQNENGFLFKLKQEFDTLPQSIYLKK